MSRCRQCNVSIKDETHVCPLCHYVLEQGGETHNAYPNVRFRTRRLMLAGRIYLFVFLLVGVLTTAVNIHEFEGEWWCGIVIASMAYLYLILRFAVIDDAGYRAKIVVLTIGGILLVVLIDILTGYDGWSVNYVIPGSILLVDAGIIFLMLYNLRNWQSYLMFQIGMILCSLIPLLLWRIGVITEPLLSLIACGASVFLFLGSLIIGDRRARVELKRRFHVR